MKRYEIRTNIGYDPVESDNGQWVLFSDVDPLLKEMDTTIFNKDRLLSEKDKEIERLRDCEDQSIKRGAEVTRLGQRIAELESENTKLKCLLNTAV